MKGSLRRIVAVLAATATLGGTAFVGVSSAYADDQTSATQPQATTADQTETKQQTQAEAVPAPQDESGITVEWTAPKQAIGGDGNRGVGGAYAGYHNSIAIPVNISGLEKGAKYEIIIRDTTSKKMTVGDEFSGGVNGYPYNSVSFTADNNTYVGNVPYNYFGLPAYSDYGLYIAITKKNPDNTSTCVYVSDTVPVKVLDADTLIKVGKINADNPGNDTVELSATYDIDPSLWDQVDSVCLSSTALRVYSATATGNNNYNSGYGFLDAAYGSNYMYLRDCTANDSGDDAVRNLVQGQAGDEAIGQNISTGTTYSVNATDPDLRLTSNTGTLKSTITGLLPDTHYGNWGSDASGLCADDYLAIFMQGKKLDNVKDPLAATFAGLVVTFKDGTVWMQPYSDDQLLDFTTQPVEQDTILSSDKLTDDNRGGVEGENNGKATAGSPYRVYINNLVDSCKALPEGSYCH